MDYRTAVARTLIVCGTILNLAAIMLLFTITYFSAADARDHRDQAAALLRSTQVDRVELTDWSPPRNDLAWVISAGGFVMVFLGIGVGMVRTASSKSKKPRVEHEWADRESS